MSFAGNQCLEVPAFGTKGRNQGGNPSESVPTAVKDIKRKGLSENSIWLTVKQGGNLLGITDRAVKKNCKAGKYVTTMVDGNGGRQYRILLSSLPEKAVMKWRMERIDLVDGVDKVDVLAGVDAGGSGVDLREIPELFLHAPAYNRKKFEKYFPFFQAVGFFEAGVLPAGKVLQQLIDEWNKDYPDKSVGLKAVYKMAKDVKHQGVGAFFGGYGRNRGESWSFARLAKEGLDGIVFGTFRKTFLQPSAPSMQECVRLVREAAIAAGLPAEVNLPVAATFERRLHVELEQEYGLSGHAAVFYARFGRAAYESKFGHHIDRDDSDCPAGYAWVFDHMQLDIMVWLPDRSKMVRFWLTGVLDMRSWKLMSYVLKPAAPNSQDIIDAYVCAVERYGLPHAVYLDNGKDYRSKDFSGRSKKVRIEHDELWMRSVLGQTGVQRVIFSEPYNARAKRIERWFRDLHNTFERVIGDGYTGTNAPARTDELKKVIKQGNVLDAEQFVPMLDVAIDKMHNRPTSKRSKLQGLSHNEAWARFAEERPMISQDVLVSLMGRTGNSRRIGRNGYEDTEVSKRIGYTAVYWGPWMSVWKGNGKRVYSRRSLEDPQRAFFFCDESHEFLGIGYLDYFRVKSLAEGEAEQRRLEEAYAEVKQERKRLKAATKPAGPGLTGRNVFELETAKAHGMTPTVEGAVKKELPAKKTGTDGRLLSQDEREALNNRLNAAALRQIPDEEEW